MRIYPPLVAGLYFIVAWILSYFLPSLKIFNLPYNLIGVIIILLGLWMLIFAANLFHQQGTTHNPYGLPEKLVTNGPYKFSRNPMYLGQLMVILGAAVLLKDLYFLLAVVAFGLTINKFFIAPEEKKLTQIFGADYLDYKKRVRRWV